MGIRVVQKALPPPPPFLYSPGGPTPSPKQRNRYKMTLFSSRSVPLETKDFTQQNVTSITPMKFKAPYVKVQVDQEEKKNVKSTKIEDTTSPTLSNDEGGGDFTSRVEEFIDDTEENSLSSQKCSSVRGKTNEGSKEVEKRDSVKVTKMEGSETTQDKGIDHTSTMGHTIDADGVSIQFTIITIQITNIFQQFRTESAAFASFTSYFFESYFTVLNHHPFALSLNFSPTVKINVLFSISIRFS